MLQKCSQLVENMSAFECIYYSARKFIFVHNFQQGKPFSLTKAENSESIEGLRKTVMEYEEKIIGLEAEVSKV